MSDKQIILDRDAEEDIYDTSDNPDDWDDSDDEDEDVWGYCFCGEPLRYSDGEYCTGCGEFTDR